VATLKPRNDRLGGLKRRVGSCEQIKTVMAGPNPGAEARGLGQPIAIATGLTNEQLHE